MSRHALTCDPDCQGGDCLCDCPCHPQTKRKVCDNGTAPEQCANTAEGLTNTDCVGVEMATPNLTGSWLARLDGCPQCIDNAELPYGLSSTPNKGDLALYKCSDCGHRWHTMWKREAAA